MRKAIYFSLKSVCFYFERNDHRFSGWKESERVKCLACSSFYDGRKQNDFRIYRSKVDILNTICLFLSVDGFINVAKEEEVYFIFPSHHFKEFSVMCIIIVGFEQIGL